MAPNPKERHAHDSHNSSSSPLLKLWPDFPLYYRVGLSYPGQTLPYTVPLHRLPNRRIDPTSQNQYPQLPPPPTAQLQQPQPSHVRRGHNRHHTIHTTFRRIISPSFLVSPWSEEQFIKATSYVLDTAAEVNKNYVGTPSTGPETLYFSASKPDVSTKDYIRRLVTYSGCSPAVFVVMLIYIDRVASANLSLFVTPYNMHRLLISALVLAAKYLEDKHCSTEYFAKVGGVSNAREMKRLELQYAEHLNCCVNVELHDFIQKLNSLMQFSQLTSSSSVTVLAPPVTPASILRNSMTTSAEPVEPRTPKVVKKI